MALDIDGFNELQKELRILAEKVDSNRVVDAALTAGAQPIYQQMQINTTRPSYKKTGRWVQSGHMKSALRIKKPRTRHGERIVTIGIHRQESPADPNTGAYYANPVEFGHGGPAPAPEHPWIRAAYDTQVEVAFSEIVNVLKQNIK